MRKNAFDWGPKALTAEQAKEQLRAMCHKFGGAWVVVPHPSEEGKFVVGGKGVVPGEVIEEMFSPVVTLV